MGRYEMGWSQAEGGWMVVYAESMEEAQEKFESGEYSIEEDGSRVCSNCGKVMTEGYYLAGDYACSDECCLALYNGDEKQMQEDLSHADEVWCDTYWTVWED